MMQILLSGETSRTQHLLAVLPETAPRANTCANLNYKNSGVGSGGPEAQTLGGNPLPLPLPPTVSCH